MQQSTPAHLTNQLPITPPENKKKSFMRSVLSVVGSNKKPSSNESIGSPDSSCSPNNHPSGLTTPPISRSCSPATPVSYLSSTSSLSESIVVNPDHKMNRVLYRHDQSQVFHWKNESWYAVQKTCMIQVCQTGDNQSYITVYIKESKDMYLNACISSSTVIQRISPTDINLTVLGEENYLFHLNSKEDVDQLVKILQELQDESSTGDDINSSLQLAMQCQCKLYLQSSSAKWSSFGSVSMKISQHQKTKKMHLAVESHKKVLVSAMVQSRNVERLGPKRISLLFNNEKTSMVYMIQVREELTGDKIVEYLKEKNAQFGW
ncbi:hypothetical protein G6F57_009072 [Rhizopus arrhizus]|uniref:Uncharacterized protein n=1 Tax=Rhizopus oryzae TaxID=64495 RepID=A0A9P6X273_RHIOR|nr:hypothetical protein G6F24_008149 [Rhizopus arrhizus]KAG1416932.1 hypothetical protein G6F58_005735 [Rhizopus delemar]KAG0773349.1 hypothetical protein G6F22_014949 [Rhizopus arrhizus]KAG0789427.1 hypothetical protein G6F21_006520 [Rhizopus arrhizus]KAG0809659.1 hypothetical protein G6F20_008599 [Rhizopus arrhizus]